MLKSVHQVKNVRFCSAKAPSSFDVDLCNSNYASKAARAAKARCGEERESTFRMILPPPNVTGKLHLGHALTVTVEDSIARYHRIRGRRVDWLPGFDHAGIATQSVVERELWREKGIKKADMSTEEFLKYCKKWADRNTSVISEQLKRLGASLNWSNCYYTLDENFSAAVTRAFCELHMQGLIFRDKRLIHWCPHLRSGLSNQEVDHLNIPESGVISIPSHNGGRRNVIVGQMYSVRYYADNGEDFLEVGTTRPETIFADVALAIHPADGRYKRWIGQTVTHPFVKRRLPVIADEAVIWDKGTGVLKITPSHDVLDAEIASRHWEEIEKVEPDAKSRVCLDEGGFLVNTLPEYDNLDRFDARQKIVSDLLQRGVGGRKMDSSGGQISVCSRTGDVIEPRLASQWFMDCTDMHKEAEKALKEGRIRIVPSYENQHLLDWFSYTEPWCLSRQLLWGHRIPAYRREQDESNWVIANSRSDAEALLRSDQILQDKDVLDTWFGSALVPLVTSGWMRGCSQFEMPPISLMETGNDILGFWVARMIIVTMRLTGGQIPFSRILLHGLVRDASGRKMSKSLGNVIDPLDVLDGRSQKEMIQRVKDSGLSTTEIEAACADIKLRFPNGLPRSGADALRFALLRHDITAADVPLNVAVLADEGLKFCNKLWNLATYVEHVRNIAKGGEPKNLTDVDLQAIDRWLLSRLHSTLSACDSYMSSDQPHLAFQQTHLFILSNLCDVYLETTKRALWSNDFDRLVVVDSVLSDVVSKSLCQLSAFMPFVSEHLHERLRKKGDEGIHEMIVESDPSLITHTLESSMNCALSIVSAVRSVKAQLQLPQRMKFEGILYTSSINVSDLSPVISSLCDLHLFETRDLSQKIESSSMICSVPGYDAKLAISIEESHRTEFINRLRRQMEKTEFRASQFKYKAEKYEELVNRDVLIKNARKSVIEKNELKARRARAVSEAAQSESERLQSIIEEMEMQGKI